MMIRDMFADDINRKINGVIKVDQAADDVIEQLSFRRTTSS